MLANHGAGIEILQKYPDLFIFFQFQELRDIQELFIRFSFFIGFNLLDDADNTIFQVFDITDIKNTAPVFEIFYLYCFIGVDRDRDDFFD